MKKYIVSAWASIFVLGFAMAQSSPGTSDWKLYPGKTDSLKKEVLLDTLFKLTKAQKEGKVTVKIDGRVEKVSQDLAGGNVDKPKTKGYRIQIISMAKKSVVDSERGRLMKEYNSVKTVVDYKEPNFRLKAGNFRTKLEAEKFQNEIKSQFPGTLVISDWIELPELD